MTVFLISFLVALACGLRFRHFVYGNGVIRPWPGGDRLFREYLMIWLAGTALAGCFFS